MGAGGRHPLLGRPSKRLGTTEDFVSSLGVVRAHGHGKAIANREPFVRTTRVKMQNLVQDYTDKLYAERLKPGQTPVTPPPPAKKEPPPKP